ncbi:hypothetical protein [Pseudomonas sp. NPDC089569]|uniref:hypothetical protein n=1 Tax=Pseudomonas sp. NPDC089569 TaxID=3390722 RepID=UPI003D075738
MHDRLTKARFINALIREHVAIHSRRKIFGRETFAAYLQIEVDASSQGSVCRLIIRGNVVGTHWMIFETEHPTTAEGMLKAHHDAIDIVFTAVKRISARLNEPASIGIEPMRYYQGWYTATT